MHKDYSLEDRILGCLYVAGMGDALGAPSEALSRHEILEKFGGYITEFLGPGDSYYVKGNVAGEVTDDTTQMYEMARSIVKSNGNFSVEDAARTLIYWSEKYPKYYPRNAGATTRFVIEELKSGLDPRLVGKTGRTYGRGTSNGAAMRVASAGLVNPGDLDGAIKTAIIMSTPSHATQHSFSGACAIACGIAEALMIDASIHSVTKACIYGIKRGYDIGIKEGRIASGADLLNKTLKAIEIALVSDTMDDVLEKLDMYVGNDGSMQSSVASAIAIFIATNGDYKNTIIYGANLGGDTDTIACIAGMIAGAYSGYSVIDNDWIKIFDAANKEFDFRTLAHELTEITKN